MRPRIFALLLCFALTPVVGMAAGAQRSRRPRGGVPARADLSGPLAQLFPADTFLYLEASDLASVADEMGGVEALYALLEKAFGDKAGATSNRFPLTVAQFRAVLGSSMAVGVLVPEAVAGESVEPVVVWVVRAPSREAADLMRQIVADAERQGATKTRPTVQTVRGTRVTTVNGPNPKSAISYALVDNVLVLGTPSGVSGVLAGSGSARTRRLADLPGFASASSRVASNRQVFAYLNGAPMVRAFNEGVDASLHYTGAGRRTGGAPERPEAAALKAFLGVDAIVGGSLSALADGGKLAVQMAVELDRSRGGLVSVMSDAPPIALRAARLLPADTDFVLAHSVDSVALYDLVVRVLTPQVAQALGLPPPPEAIAALEGRIGMRLRDDLLAAFGNEAVVGVWIDRHEGLARVRDEGTKDDVEGVTLFEVRNPETVEAALTKIFAGEAGAPKEVYRDVPVLGLGSFSYAYIDGFGVLGEHASVVRVVDAVRSNQTLATSPTYTSAVGAVPNNVIMATFASPRIFEFAAKMLAPGKTVPHDAGSPPSGLFFAIQKDATGIYATFEIPLPNLRMLIERSRRADVSRR